MDTVHEGEVFEDPIVVRPVEPEDVDWGPRPTKTGRRYRADGTTVNRGQGGNTVTTTIRIKEQEEIFLRSLVAWLAARRVIDNRGPGKQHQGGGGQYLPTYGDAIAYLISAYGAGLDREMRAAGVDPESGERLALPEVTK